MPFIRDETTFARKVAALKAGGARTLHVVSDFDQTLTKAFANGKPVHTSFAHIRANGYLSPEYAKEAYALVDRYAPFVNDHALTQHERAEKMHEWWSKHLPLMVRYGMHKDIIADIVQNQPMHARDGFQALLDLTHAKGIPLLVFSAGLGDIIEGQIRYAHTLPANVHVISNFYAFDENGAVTGYRSALIHAGNKGEVALKETPYGKEIAQRTNVLLLGDSLDDVHMADGLHHDAILRIGFLNGRTEKLEAFAHAFDVVLEEDCGLDFVLALLEEVTKE